MVPNKAAALERRNSASVSVDDHWRGVGQFCRSTS